MLTKGEQEQLQALLAKQRSSLLAGQGRMVTICGRETRYVPPTGAHVLRLSLEEDKAAALLGALRAAFPDLEREYGVENLSVGALRECLTLLLRDLDVGQDKLPQ